MSAAPLKTRLRRRLQALGEGSDSDVRLGDAALWLAGLYRAEGNAADDDLLAPYQDHLADLVAMIDDAAHFDDGRDPSVDDMATALRSVLVETLGYAGDGETYDDLDNADLISVIDRRRGLPVSLGILYLHPAQSLGWQAEGLNFPGHFLIRLTDRQGGRMILDPFHAGRAVDAADLRGLLKATQGVAAELSPVHTAPCSRLAILLRLQNNIKSRLLALGDVGGALTVVDAMLLLAPSEGALWREVALLNLRLGNAQAALAALDQARLGMPAGEERARVERMLEELHQRLQ